MKPVLAINIKDQFEPAQKFDNLGSLINLIVTNIFVLAGIILFIGVIAGGFIIMTKGANPDEMHKGQQLLSSCLIGIVLIFVSYFIVKVVLQVLGIASFL